MMKHEFEEAMGFSVSPETYERIEAVYTGCDFFENKEQLYNFYKHYDMNGIERMYKMVLEQGKRDASLNTLQVAHKELVERCIELDTQLTTTKAKLKAITEIVVGGAN